MTNVKTKPTLRDRREPGHFWADNEIFDVFGDELGQNGIMVYMALARHCYGATVKLSLREIAGEARMGKDRVARALKVMVDLGLVIEAKSERTRAVSSWSLANVKKLVQKRMAAAQTNEPPQPMTMALSDVGGAATAGREGICLTVRQMNAVDKKICATRNETDLSQNTPHFETDLSHGEVPSNSKTQDTKLQDTPLPPAVRGERSSADLRADSTGELRTATEAGGDGELGEAVAKVLRECNLSNRKLAPVILAAMKLHASRGGATADWHALAEHMVKSQREYLNLGSRGLLKFTVGMRKFFSEGLWLNDGLWGVDFREVRMQRRL